MGFATGVFAGSAFAGSIATASDTTLTPPLFLRFVDSGIRQLRSGGIEVREVTIKRGSRLPAWSFQITREDGEPVVLTGATLTLRIRNRHTGTLVVNDAAISVTDAEQGLCSYAWAAADTASAYEGLAEVTVTNGSSVPMLVPTLGYVAVHVPDSL